MLSAIELWMVEESIATNGASDPSGKRTPQLAGHDFFTGSRLAEE